MKICKYETQSQPKYGFIMLLEIWYYQYKTSLKQLYLDLGNEQPYMTKSQIKQELSKHQDFPMYTFLISITPYVMD